MFYVNGEYSTTVWQTKYSSENSNKGTKIGTIGGGTKVFMSFNQRGDVEEVLVENASKWALVGEQQQEIGK